MNDKVTSQQNNPLSAYFRTPKMYTTLPTAGKFYSAEIIDLPENGELAVYPMTTKDEMMLKNPDALLNGEAVSNLIKSCIPEIKQPKEMYSADVDAALIAIRGASGGDEVEVSAECPKCNEPNTVTISVEGSLSAMTPLEDVYSKTLSNGLNIIALPFTYKSTIKAGVASFQSTRSMQNISEMTDDMDRLKAFNESFIKLADLNFEMIIDSVQEIQFQNAEGEQESVVDRASIREFLENTDNKTGKEIEAFINEVNDAGVKNEVRIECQAEECDEVFEAPINFDPVNFFTAS